MARTSPIMTVYRRPKMSLKLPAIENETDDAMDQPPTIQVMLIVSPRSVPIWTRMAEGMMKPHDIGQTYERHKDYVAVSLRCYRRGRCGVYLR